MSVDAQFLIKHGDFTLDVAFTLPAKGITALFGPSGSGKTTLLRAIAGLEHQANNFLKVDDQVWQDTNYCLPAHKRPIGYVFQEASLFAHLTVLKNIEYGLKRVPAEHRHVSIERAIELLGIESLLQRKPGTLSGGERQRVAIARALAVSPRLLLMDEPLAALDAKRKQEILPYIESLSQTLDIPVIYVSHSPDEVARLADHLVLLENGRIKATDTIQNMLTRLDLPLAHARDAETLIEATVTGHDNEYALTYLSFTGGLVTVEHQSLEIGSHVRVRIAARDVSLTLLPQTGTSILNIYAATIDDMTNDGNSQVIVRLLINGIPLLARVTRKSAAILDLQPGKKIYAQAKSVALLA